MNLPTQDTIEKTRYYSLSDKPKGISDFNIFLPYFATVTEDLPGSCKQLEPKVYKGCQLLSKKHGGYLEFYHKETGKTLRIAINSHTYKPENKSHENADQHSWQSQLQAPF